MLTCKKFTGDNLDELLSAIVMMKNNYDNTHVCAQDLLNLKDNIYYVYDPDNTTIVAAIVGDTEIADNGEIMVYNIRHLVYSTSALAIYNAEDLIYSMIWMVREYSADKKGKVIRFDIPNKCKKDEFIIKALRSNNFIHHINDNRYLKVYMPRDRDE